MNQKKSNSEFELRREDRKPIFDSKKVRASKSSMALLVGLGLSVGALSSCEKSSVEPTSGEQTVSSSSDEPLAGVLEYSSGKIISSSSSPYQNYSNEEPESGVIMPPFSSSSDSVPLSSSSYWPPSSSEPPAGSSVTTYPLESPIEPLAGSIIPYSSSEKVSSSSEPISGDPIPLSSSEGSSSGFTPSMPTAGMPMVIDDDSSSGEDQGVL